jgi:hypothetical protein
MGKTTPVNGKWKTFSENIEIELLTYTMGQSPS